MGDLNAEIKKEELIRSVAGHCSLHENTNENGLLLAQCTEIHRMINKITVFRTKISIKEHVKLISLCNISLHSKYDFLQSSLNNVITNFVY